MIAWVERHRRDILVSLTLLVSAASVFLLLYRYYPDHSDWTLFYSKLTRNILHPMQVNGYVNPPWASLLTVYGLLPLRVSNVINMMINMVVLLLLIRKVKGGWAGILLTFTSPLFWDMGRVNPIDWIPVLGFILPPAIGFPLMAVKPQTLGAAAIVKWKNMKFKFAPLIPLIVVVAVSFVIWGNWLPKDTGELISTAWNFSFWPVSIPLGGYVFYRAYKEGDEILAGAATPLLVPYIAPYSLVSIIALLSGKYRKIAIAIYIFSIWYFMIEYRRLASLW